MLLPSLACCWTLEHACSHFDMFKIVLHVQSFFTCFNFCMFTSVTWMFTCQHLCSQVLTLNIWTNMHVTDVNMHVTDVTDVSMHVSYSLVTDVNMYVTNVHIHVTNVNMHVTEVNIYATDVSMHVTDVNIQKMDVCYRCQHTKMEIHVWGNSMRVAWSWFTPVYLCPQKQEHHRNPTVPTYEARQALVRTLAQHSGVRFSYKQHLHLPCTPPKNPLSQWYITKISLSTRTCLVVCTYMHIPVLSCTNSAFLWTLQQVLLTFPPFSIPWPPPSPRLCSVSFTTNFLVTVYDDAFYLFLKYNLLSMSNLNLHPNHWPLLSISVASLNSLKSNKNIPASMSHRVAHQNPISVSETKTMDWKGSPLYRLNMWYMRWVDTKQAMQMVRRFAKKDTSVRD